MAINYFSERVQVPPFRRREVNVWIHDVAQKYGHEIGDINYQFCDNEKILEVNQKYLGHDYYTDIITFDNSSEPEILFADIVISIEMVESNASDYGVSFEEELFRVMIHGILHLCGLDDEEEEVRQEMRRAEDAALAMLPREMHEMWRKGVKPRELE